LKHHSDRHKQRIFLSLFIAVFLTNASIWAAPKPKPKPTPRLSNEETISGAVQSIGEGDNSGGDDGGRSADLEIRTIDGMLIEIRPDSNLVVHPSGVRIKPGMRIKAVGYTSGENFIAREITVLGNH
jgi:hypothetical protein